MAKGNLIDNQALKQKGGDIEPPVPAPLPPVLPTPPAPKPTPAYSSKDRYPTTANPFGPGKFQSQLPEAVAQRKRMGTGEFRETTYTPGVQPDYAALGMELNNKTWVPKGWTADANGIWTDTEGHTYNASDQIKWVADVQAGRTPTVPTGAAKVQTGPRIGSDEWFAAKRAEIVGVKVQGGTPVYERMTPEQVKAAASQPLTTSKWYTGQLKRKRKGGG